MIDDMFWSKVQKTPTCWLWTGSERGKGYGSVTRKGKTYKTNRYVYEKTFGPIPKGLCVCHKCDVRKCVRPDHLFLGTHRENMLDMIRKGRNAKVRKKQKFCKRGHLRSGKNLYVQKNGVTHCRKCRTINQQKSRGMI